MRRLKWNFVFAGFNGAKNVRSLRVRGIFVTLCVLIVLIGLAGFGRIVYLGANYIMAVYDAVDQRLENDRLKDRIANLEGVVVQDAETISYLVTYEDNARLKYGMEAISSDVRMAGVGGFPSYEEMLYSSMTDSLIVKAEALRHRVYTLSNQAELQEATFSQVSQKAQKVHANLSKRPSMWPANGRITSTFGYRFHPFTGLRMMHEGLDIANSPWTPIYASADGQAIEANSLTHFGNMVKLRHNEEYVTLYGHMIKIAVTQGQFVKRGDIIGYIGSTGRSTGPHLHYEVHRNGSPVDPMQYIIPIDQIVD